jgi:hypothetical protein
MDQVNSVRLNSMKEVRKLLASKEDREGVDVVYIGNFAICLSKKGHEYVVNKTKRRVRRIK